MSMFEIATRKKYRFPFRGSISVEDLWDLDLSQLDMIFKSLNQQAKVSSEESLLSDKKEDEDLLNKISIVKYIFATKKSEADALAMAATKKQQKDKILAIIAQKKDADLAGKSIEELTAMVEEL